MVLEVVEHLSEWLFGSSIFIEVASVGLLPLERNTDVFAIGDLLPLFAGGHDLADEVRVVAAPHVVFIFLGHDH